MNLTTTTYWRRFWQQNQDLGDVSPKLKNDRDIATSLVRFLGKAAPGAWAVELGCAPCKWLAFLNRRLGYRVAGVDWLASGVEQTHATLSRHGVPDAERCVVQADFLSVTPPRAYDVVLSLGFLEHFADTDPVFARHVAWLAEGGTLLLGVPNFRGVNRLIQAAIDPFSSPGILATHNPAAMDPRRLRGLGRTLGLQEVHIGYLGGFEPALFDPSPVPYRLRRLAIRATIRALGATMGRLPLGATSGYLMAVFRKPARHAAAAASGRESRAADTSLPSGLPGKPSNRPHLP